MSGRSLQPALSVPISSRVRYFPHRKAIAKVLVPDFNLLCHPVLEFSKVCRIPPIHRRETRRSHGHDPEASAGWQLPELFQHLLQLFYGWLHNLFVWVGEIIDRDSEHFIGLVGCRIKQLEMEAQELLFA